MMAKVNREAVNDPTTSRMAARIPQTAAGRRAQAVWGFFALAHFLADLVGLAVIIALLR